MIPEKWLRIMKIHVNFPRQDSDEVQTFLKREADPCRSLQEGISHVIIPAYLIIKRSTRKTRLKSDSQVDARQGEKH